MKEKMCKNCMWWVKYLRDDHEPLSGKCNYFPTSINKIGASFCSLFEECKTEFVYTCPECGEINKRAINFSGGAISFLICEHCSKHISYKGVMENKNLLDKGEEDEKP